MNKVTLISVKPEFALRILDGSKTIELRKSAPKVSEGDVIVLYSTSPEMAVIGYCTVKGLIKSSPKSIWESHSKELGIDKKRFFEYYQGRTSAIGIVLSNSTKLTEKVPLSKVRELMPTFQPPQTFKYLSFDFLTSLDSKIERKSV